MAYATATMNVTLEKRVSDIRQRIETTLSNDRLEALKILDELQTFSLGRHLILHSSLNGYWTRYCVADQAMNRKTALRDGLGELEDFILNRAPTMQATQERFEIFQRETQVILHDEMTVASIPCGFMDDLLSLDYSQTSNIRRVGLDIDPESVEGALANAKTYALKAEAYIGDAWDLRVYAKQFDLITSNGLNIYVDNQEHELELYRSFASALKPRGWLITSFLTSPPSMDRNSPWQIIDRAAVLRQKIIFSDILNANWRVFRNEAQMRELLALAGFEVLKVSYDRQKLFPAVVARSRLEQLH